MRARRWFRTPQSDDHELASTEFQVDTDKREDRSANSGSADRVPVAPLHGDAMTYNQHRIPEGLTHHSGTLTFFLRNFGWAHRSRTHECATRLITSHGESPRPASSTYIAQVWFRFAVSTSKNGNVSSPLRRLRAHSVGPIPIT